MKTMEIINKDYSQYLKNYYNHETGNCSVNAYEVCEDISSAKFVTGFVLDGDVLALHHWNVLDGELLDTTLGAIDINLEYIELGRLDSDVLNLKCKDGNYIVSKYKEEIKCFVDKYSHKNISILAYKNPETLIYHCFSVCDKHKDAHDIHLIDLNNF